MNISKSEYAERLIRLQEKIRASGLDTFVVSTKESIYYLTGAGYEPLERPFFLLVGTSGAPWLLAPMLERDHLAKAHNIDPANIVSYWDYPAPAGSGWPDRLLDLIGSNRPVGVEPGLTMEIRSTIPFEVRPLPLVEQLRMVKSKREVEMIRRAAGFSDRAVKELIDAAYYGAAVVEGYARTRTITMAMAREVAGWQPVESSVLMATWAAPRSAQPHSIPALDDRTLDGPHVALAVVRCNGYAAECERTFFTSEPTKWSKAAFAAMMEARRLAAQMVRPGLPCGELDRTVTEFLAREGYSAPETRLHRVGHGFGLGNHEAPWISDGSEEVLAENMVISIEPGIYDKAHGGVRHSDTVLVTSSGAEFLTAFPDALQELMTSGLRLKSKLTGALVRRALRLKPRSQTIN